jgi:alkylhydroperoxidase/carboxymuconolactone decarboxylase family protein YurZ
LANDVTLTALHEAILFSAADAGYPAAFGALVQFKKICMDLKLEVPQEAAEYSDSAQIDYFKDLPFLPLDGDFGGGWRAPMARFWNGGGLSQKERGYLSLIANIAQQVLGAPFTHHVRLALKHGAHAKELIALVNFTSKFGFSKAWTAANALTDVLKMEGAEQDGVRA